MTDLATSLDLASLDPVLQACLHALSGPRHALAFFDLEGARRFTSDNLGSLFGRSTSDAPRTFDAFHEMTSWPTQEHWALQPERAPRPLPRLLEHPQTQDTLWVRVCPEDANGWELRASFRAMELQGHVIGVLATYERIEHSPLKQVLERLPMGVIIGPRGPNPIANATALRLLDVGSLSEPRCPMCALDVRENVLCGPNASVQEMLSALHGANMSTVFLRQGEDQETETRVVIHAYALEEDLRLLILEDVTRSHQRDKKRDEILSIASHELRNPLTPLKGLLQIARQQREHTGRVDGSLLQKAESQVSRITRLLDGLLDLSRLETGRMTGQQERTDLSRLVRECVEIWGARHPSGRIELTIPEVAMYTDIYTPGIEQVLMNLLDNAVKYSPSETPISITLRGVNDRAMLSITDLGRGMEPDVLERVFDRFFQGPRPPRQPSSLGLGLYISRKIIQEHEGTIEIESQPGHGTTVTLGLQLS